MSYSTPEPSLVWADHCEGEIFGLEFSGLELWGSGHRVGRSGRDGQPRRDSLDRRLPGLGRSYLRRWGVPGFKRRNDRPLGILLRERREL